MSNTSIVKATETMTSLNKDFRLYDFNVYNEKTDNNNNDDDNNSTNSEDKIKYDNNLFIIQMFGLNELGKSCSIIVEGFNPFFYVKVDDNWTITIKNMFLTHIIYELNNHNHNGYYNKSIVECKIIKRKKLYGFDGGKEHKFIVFKFKNNNVFNKVRNFWYEGIGFNRKLKENGYIFNNSKTYLYEANIPPLLRFFHIKDISPSGWVSLPTNKIIKNKKNKKTNCDYEFTINYKDIIPLNNKETLVPLKICSFDIEASSSHGDFPVPIKTYNKLATNIIEYFEKTNNKYTDLNENDIKNTLKNILLKAFNFPLSDNPNSTSLFDRTLIIELVYPINPPKNKDKFISFLDEWFKFKIKNDNGSKEFCNQLSIETLFEKNNKNNFDDDDCENQYKSNYKKLLINKELTVIDIIRDTKLERSIKIIKLNESFDKFKFPKLNGDKVTFIGSTFLKLGDKEPYLNHCVALNTCDNIEINNSQIESYNNEKDLLLGWRNIIQKENPDVIIGYNIFGFDYDFMFRRAQENDCVEEFLKLSKNNNEVCVNRDYKTNECNIEETKIVLASGEHELKYIKMNGRIQIDLYNYFRREENLTSYKLDYVSGYFIGDYIKSLNYVEEKNLTTFQTTNMTGIMVGSFIHFEEIGHTTDYYNNGAKFEIITIDINNCMFQISGSITPDMNKKVRWCLAKDDVTPKDIFRMTNGTSYDRSIIAKYCIQDCNLVHHLMRKVDLWTGFTEMAKICSVPINFLILRGQGIKLTSFVAKKCRDKRTLMPVIEKDDGDNDGYEGAIVLEPKCDLYLDNPVACVDYASLYPSSMISENISHDSKVWSVEYDLNGNLVETIGERNENGDFIYDNLPGYEYVNIQYDTFKYIRNSPTEAAKKTICGYKICRFAQFPNGTKAIMPSILEELLMARKTTRKLIPLEKDDFMKNILDKRQLGYKVTANSLYGQCGAKTSSFYEIDCAASTTATGRLLLNYAKTIVEECYGDAICQTTKYGQVLTKAEYIYGDTDSVFFTFNLQTLDNVPIRGKEALEITIELAQEAGHLASSFLKGPHDLEYEKTFMPFCLLSKKRYVGMLYETDVNKCKRKEMGIVLKRRDNAPIVKEIYGEIIDILMKQQNIKKAIQYLKKCLRNIVDEKYPIDKLIISKSLRSGYKNPQQISHKVLADRIAERDPGNKPSSGDRIPYVYIHNKDKNALQGNKIETPTYVIENKLKIDYSFYITNQIMKPVQQLFALILEKIWTMEKKYGKIKQFKEEINKIMTTNDIDKVQDKIDNLRNKEVKSLLFDEFLRETNNKKENNREITSIFNRIK